MSINIIAHAHTHGSRRAIIAPEGVFSYADLLDASARVAAALSPLSVSQMERGSGGEVEARVVFLTPPGFDYAATQWGIWRAGGIAVPLAVSYPRPEIEYIVDDSQATILVAHPTFERALRPIAEERRLRFVLTSDALRSAPCSLPSVDPDRRAMILYTSGTTGKPKGVVSAHRTIQAQVTTLVDAWEWSPDDHILLILPLHHVHGIINVLTCALWSGATCEILPDFNANAVWDRFLQGDVTLFMAVPTIYTRLIAAWEAAPPERRVALSKAAGKLRLMVSGSAALPVSVLERWREVTGHTLLERYGMTEIGMALSNPLHGRRLPGCVGTPLPGVDVRLVDDALRDVEPGAPGEILVRGPSVFREYWRRPDATRAAFISLPGEAGGTASPSPRPSEGDRVSPERSRRAVSRDERSGWRVRGSSNAELQVDTPNDAWFRTGDVAVIENGYYRILGRNSVDIIKTGGYKVSALEIEDVLLTHPAIQECAVVAVPDAEWGERVAVAVVLRPAVIPALVVVPANAGTQSPTSSGGPVMPPSPSVVPAEAGTQSPTPLTLDAMRQWAKERLAPYKVPTRMLTVAQLPRNAMGKVTKPDVSNWFKSIPPPTS